MWYEEQAAKMWLLRYDTIKCEKNNCIGERRYKRFSLLFQRKNASVYVELKWNNKNEVRFI